MSGGGGGRSVRQRRTMSRRETIGSKRLFVFPSIFPRHCAQVKRGLKILKGGTNREPHFQQKGMLLNDPHRLKPKIGEVETLDIKKRDQNGQKGLDKDLGF